MINNNIDDGSVDPHYQQLRQEAERVLRDEPELAPLLHRTVLHEGVLSFEDAVAATICYRLFLQQEQRQQQQKELQKQYPSLFPPSSCLALIRQAFDSSLLELGHSMKAAARADATAVVDRDPAMDTLLEVVLFSKGYASLVCHRAAHRIWLDSGKKFTALLIQSQVSAVFGVDIHPLARIGASVLLDHGTGIVVGETATVGDGCTILHGVTLGGTGKDHGDRHPKVGSHVLIGAGTSILGNIHIGDSAKIGAGSVVLRSIPPFATAVGAPAKIIGRAAESDPGSEVDAGLRRVSVLHSPVSSSSTSTTTTSSSPSSENDDDDSSQERDEDDQLQPQEGDTFASSAKTQVALKKCHIKIPTDCADFCPFREYRLLARSAPRGTVTLTTLASMLKPLGCTGCEIGSCMFALDVNGVGYRQWDDEFEKDALEVIPKSTSLTREVLVPVLARYRAKCCRKMNASTTCKKKKLRSPSLLSRFLNLFRP